MLTDDFAFWRFSRHVYSGPGVAEACLRLQDEHGIDVNVMLYLLFLARSGRQIAHTDVDSVESVAREWREGVVRPLREVRRRLKMPPSPFDAGLANNLRSEVKRIELESERLQQFAMQHQVPPESLGESCQDTSACARHNLGAYAQRHGGFPAEPVDAILRCFQAC
jgi:uncharacterized protein (TIGR02444 family)